MIELLAIPSPGNDLERLVGGQRTRSFELLPAPKNLEALAQILNKVWPLGLPCHDAY